MSRVVVTDVDFADETFVTFDSQGQASNSGTVSLAAGSFRMQVSVEALTGVVSVNSVSP